MAESEGTAGTPSEILSELGVGVRIGVYSEGSSVQPVCYRSTGQLVLAQDEGYSPDYVVTAYEFDGMDSAKLELALQSTGSPWTLGASGGGLTNPVQLGPPESASGFLVQDTGGGSLTMQTLDPPTPLVLGFRPSPSQGGLWLCGGSPPQAVFTFLVTG